ncbi:hypothetical protein [Oceanibaculum nanhaiense]|uniref:hypothetical protein n=1 Tax=Oceanibaculum nanhaiense TaxID=1909734 RepID=UPI003F71FDF4
MIKADVINGHIAQFPNELPIIRKLTPDFEITWAKRFNKFNADLSVYFIKPKKHISESFGFDQELLVGLSNYPKLEARFIQALEHVFQEIPAKGRVDQTVSIVLSPGEETDVWVQDYTAQHPQARAYIGISTIHLLAANDDWFVRNRLMSQLFSRDLFDYTLPLDSDLFFFGRQAIVAEHIDAIKRSENRGLFGLRKTGKTSVLFKLMRQCAESEIPVKYYDCKISSIYRLTGAELIEKICNDIESSLNIKIKGWRGKKEPAERLLTLVQRMPEDKKVCLLFDEIEYISVSSKLAPHWKNDFIPFWQSIWSVQSQFRRFSFVIAGVNASISETDKIEGVQNPMFGIVKAKYLTGFEKGELRSLTNVFGKRMGILFREDAVDMLHDRYGGHPLLTRMICSQIHTGLRTAKKQRPTEIRKNDIEKDLDSKEEEIQFYCGHITSELEEFYPIEYEMLEFLAIGNVVDFNELSEDVDLVRHLKAYGLVDMSKPFQPLLRIPVIEKYISSKWKRRTGVKTQRYVVPPHRREEFVTGRSLSILREMRVAERKFNSLVLPSLYDGNGPAEAEIFAAHGPCITREDAVSFLNQANRSLVEPIDRTGKQISKKDYFFNDIKISYPKLWKSLNRIRAYRNHLLHLELTPLAKQQYEYFITEDLEGKDPEQQTEGWFLLHSAILNGLLIGIQSEMAVYD